MGIKMNQRKTCTVIGLSFWLVARAAAGQDTLRHEVIVDAPVDQVWSAFTTKQGLESWMAAHAEVDLRVGGKMLTHYRPEGVLGDANTIENTILSFEPNRMLSVKATKPPETFPYKTAIESMWTVVYFEAVGSDRTLVSITCMGYGDDEESKKMREHFDKGNAWTLNKLRAKFALCDEQVAPVKRIDTDIVVPASLKDVWDAWTTPSGVTTFFASAANIDLKPGGAYEMLFGPDQPKGLQGSEGCQILGFRPMEFLSFTWNSPPQWPDIRRERTVVILQFQDLGKAGVRVNLTHQGFGAGKDWGDVHDYFTKAWPVVLRRLKERFEKGAIDWQAVQRAREAQAKTEATTKGASDAR